MIRVTFLETASIGWQSIFDQGQLVGCYNQLSTNIQGHSYLTITSNVGDSYARVDVRIREIYQAFEIIRELIDEIPMGPVEVPVKGFPNGEYMTRIEQPRGEALYYVKADGRKFINRMRVRTPTFANLPGLVETLKGCDLADVPILVLTIDPCISCTER